jgi:hypothetical protein
VKREVGGDKGKTYRQRGIQIHTDKPTILYSRLERNIELTLRIKR